MALSEEDRAEIAALIAAATGSPPDASDLDGDGTTVVVEPEPTPAVIDASAEAAVAVIEAQAAADVKREHALAETQATIIQEQAKAELVVSGAADMDDDGNLVELLQPEQQHPYFRTWGGRRR